MASAFNNTAYQITAESTQLNSNVQQQVQQVNQISQQIAAINGKLAAVSSSGQDDGTFLDQRGALIQQLSGLIDVSQINDGTSLTLTTKQGAALVVDGQLTAQLPQPDSNGVQQIYSAARRRHHRANFRRAAGRSFASSGPDVAVAAVTIGLPRRWHGAGVEYSESGRHTPEWKIPAAAFSIRSLVRVCSRHDGRYYRSRPIAAGSGDQRQQW